MDLLSFPDIRYEVFDTIYDGNLKVVARGRKVKIIKNKIKINNKNKKIKNNKKIIIKNKK